jgi:hypothetical protein
MSWTKLTDNKDIEAKIEEISKSILIHLTDTRDFGLMSGFGGIALFFYYYYLHSKNTTHLFHGFNIITNLIERINCNEYIPNTAFSDGLCGLGWIFTHLHEKNLIEIDTNTFFNDLDSTLSTVLIQELNKKNNYDFLYGTLGYGLYFFKRNQLKRENYLLTEIIRNLYNSQFNGNKYFPLQSFNYSAKQEVINFGLAHGLPSIIIFLSKIFHKINENYLIEELLNKTINFLLSKENKSETNLSKFPYWINNDQQISASSRLSWCYGDLGIGLALYFASKALDNNIWFEHSLDILYHSSKRRDLKINSVFDAGICHGTAGIAHIFNRMYNYTNISDFKFASEFWINETLSMASFADGFAGYKTFLSNVEGGYHPMTNLLLGIAGIGLVLLASVSSIEPNWDECLLIS